MAKELPPAFLQSLQGVSGFNEETFRQVHQLSQPVTSVRINPAKISATQFISHQFLNNANPAVSVEPVPWCTTGYYLSARPSFTFDPWLHAGAYYVQEASSMFLAHIIQSLFTNDDPPLHVLDVCAAPGGKSSLLASLLPNSFLVSNEVIKTRVTILAENMSKWGSSNVAVTHNDPRDFSRLNGYFNLIVVDAPCSGSGLFRKDADAIAEWSPENVQHCSLRQQRILTDIVPALATDGTLVYSTCSLSPQEDEEICNWLLQNFDLEPLTVPVDEDWNIVKSQTSLGATGYRFYPDKVRGEGFFITCFRRKGFVANTVTKAAGIPSLSKQEIKMVEPWLSTPEQEILFKQKDTIIAVPAKWQQEFATIQKNLYVRKSGVAVGEIKGKDLVPHHELALSGLLHEETMFVELDEVNSLRYLRRQDVDVDIAARGWALARFGHLNLGWMKVLNNRINNYYPTDWRILKP